MKQMFGENPPPAYIFDEKNKAFSFRQTSAIFILSPFVIPYLGKVRVRAYRKGDVWGIAVLRVEMAGVSA